MSSPHAEMFAQSKEFTIYGGEFNAVGRDSYKHVYHGSYMSNANNTNTTTNVNSHNRKVVYGLGHAGNLNYDDRAIEEILRAQRLLLQARNAQLPTISEGYHQPFTDYYRQLEEYPEDQARGHQTTYRDGVPESPAGQPQNEIIEDDLDFERYFGFEEYHAVPVATPPPPPAKANLNIAPVTPEGQVPTNLYSASTLPLGGNFRSKNPFLALCAKSTSV